MAMLAPGTLVGDRYEVVRFWAEGGMQEVYQAIDRSFNRIVALKVPKNPSAQSRFQRSAVASAKVNHPNVAKTLDLLRIGEADYLVEQFIAGHDLSSRLDRDYNRLDPHLAAHVIHHAAKGVAASHRVGVFHRDLKPSNIMVSEDAGLTTVKITDFGIAKMIETELEQNSIGGELTLVNSKTMLGALPYMAPEMIKKRGKHAQLPADIWALGAILYLLLVGEHPFGIGLEAVAAIMQGEVAPRGEVLTCPTQFEGLTDQLWAVIGSCLQLDPSSRPTADQLVEHLSRLAYSTAQRHEGVINSYGHSTGDWGFIGFPEGPDCFFHLDSYYGETPEYGTRVSFAAFHGTPKSRAFPVLPLKPVAPTT